VAECGVRNSDDLVEIALHGFMELPFDESDSVRLDASVVSLCVLPEDVRAFCLHSRARPISERLLCIDYVGEGDLNLFAIVLLDRFTPSENPCHHRWSNPLVDIAVNERCQNTTPESAPKYSGQQASKQV